VLELDHLMGRVFVDRYEIEAKLGDGAMGVVYKARHLKINRRFAIKILRPRLTEDTRLVERFEREAELAARMSHPNVASVVDMNKTDEGLFYYAMELAPGVPLAKLLEDGAFDADRAVAIVKQICDGLAHAHAVGLVHRDLKPDNVLVDLDDHARIVDFGLAIPNDESGKPGGKGRFTTAGIVVGTPMYMAPEQARGADVDHRTDLYALGLILYELLAGKPPFEGSGVDVAHAHVSHATPSMSIRVPDVQIDPLLEALALRLLEKNPAARIQSAREVREVLDAIDDDRRKAARILRVDLPDPTQIITNPMAPPRGSRAWLVVAIAALALSLAGALFVARRGRLDVQLAPDPAALTVAAPQIHTSDPPVIAHDDPAPPVHLLAPIPGEPLPAPAHVQPAHEATAAELVKLYTQVGRELSALETNKGAAATDDLWPRYRWIRIQDALSTPDKRHEAWQLLEHLRHDLRQPMVDSR
jgi:serine/threonine protein kinase